MDTPIYSKLRQLNKEKRIPFHMPGHKRKNEAAFADEGILKMDITEIEGYDNLHNPEGVIRESMDSVKTFYGTRESWYLVNGSTCGLLASIASVCDVGDAILIGRNCHKAVYHAVNLLHLKAYYCYPDYSEKYDMMLGVDPNRVSSVIRNHPEIRAVVITSPTYEGVVSDIYSIANVLKYAGIPLIVDEAHGAHFKFHNYFPDSAVDCGADLVIQSTHKTLPAMTQTGLLHLCSDKIDKKNVSDMLAVFETSSPSYILMASAEYGVMYMKENSAKVDKYVDNLLNFRRKCEKLKNIHIVSLEELDAFAYDGGKIVLSVKNIVSGQNFFDDMFQRFGIEFEMAGSSYCIAMTSVCDEREDFEQLYEALCQMDREYYGRKENGSCSHFLYGTENQKIMESWQCGNREKTLVTLEESAGRTAGEYVYLYPPGIPVLVPGEKIRKETMENIAQYLYNGYNVVGMEEDKICVLSHS